MPAPVYAPTSSAASPKSIPSAPSWQMASRPATVTITNRVGPLKLFVDGSLGARTASLMPPMQMHLTLHHWHHCYGSQNYLDEICAIAAENGMSVATHAIGDKAIEMILEAYEKSLPDSSNPLRNGVIHCQITTPATLEQFRKNNILAQVQPIFIHYDKNIVFDRVGEELAKTSYAFKTLADMGVHVSYGTDSPVEEIQPLQQPLLRCNPDVPDRKG